MAFTSIITHRLLRTSPDAQVTKTLCEQLWPLNGKTEDCVRSLKHAWLKRGGKVYGRFSDDAGANPLPAWLKGWQNKSQTFVALSKQWIQQAEVLLAATENVLDVYCVFALEQLEAGDRLWLFLTGHEPAFAINGDLQLDESHYLDVSRFLMAANINLTEWQAGDSAKYLTLVRAAGEKELSEWFMSVVGFTDKLDTAKQTEQLLAVVEDYAQKLPAEQAEQTREKVVEYCLEQSKAGESVALAALSSSVTPEGAPEFKAFADAHDAKPAADLVPHAGQLRQYVRISGRNEQMSMSFSSGCLGEAVIYDAQSDSLTIHNIPPALKSRLLKHMK
ncbi:nucleoid-associated protein [Marinagarivorans algicola]|uniref:nucleoid-associated protein n=1 Tax=Marinagarivorans algicola TaxID=1513270 RepID=UPI0006B41CCC|nr:nucleoid-associated protein [Marinagarivorans algicola]